MTLKSPSAGWISKGISLEVQLVAIPFFLAVVTASLLWTIPTTLPRILAVDATFLAQAHVAATFWRVLTMPLTNRQRRVLAVDLLLACVVLCLVIVRAWSVAILATVYMFWQVFHYVRQSFGIERILRRRGQQSPSQSMATLLFASALATFMWAQARVDKQFLGMPVFGLPPSVCVTAAVLAGLVALWSLWRVGRDKDTGFTLATVFGLSHLAVFLIAYVGFDRLEHSWLVSNVWHNAQYVLIVRNTLARPVSSGSQSGGATQWLAARAAGVPFVAACALVGFLAYGLLGSVLQAALTGSAAGVLAVYMGLNFHHYVVDGLIWKRRSSALEAIA